MAEIINYRIEDYESVKVIKILGNLTINTARGFVSVLEQLIDKESIIVDLENVENFTSTGINAMVKISVDAKENSTRVVFVFMKDEYIHLAEELDYFKFFTLAKDYDEALVKIKVFT